MLNPEHFIVTLARSIDLFRTRPDAVEEHKASLRAVVSLCKLGPAKVVVQGDTITVLDSEVPIALPGISNLLAQFQAHGVAEVSTAKDAAPADLLGFIKAVASHPNDGITVPTDGSVAVELSLQRAPPPNVEEPVETEDTEGLLREGDMLVGIHDTGHGGPALAEALEELKRSPYEGEILGRLAALGARISEELSENRVERAVEALAIVAELASHAPSGTAENAYAIALGRLFTNETLAAVADMVLDSRHAQQAIDVLGLSEGNGAAVLVERLKDAPGVQECRAYLKALRKLKPGIPMLAPLLDRDEWYIAQSVAEFMGELELTEAVPHLAEAMEHGEPRVRSAAAGALARIGNAKAIERLRTALGSKDAVLRTAVLRSISGRKSGVLASAILQVADAKDSDAETQRDCYRALGRIGTPQAIQALFRAVEPGGRLLGRQPTEQRLAALDGLRLSGENTVVKKLEELTSDRDKLVRGAAEKALAELRDA